MKKEKKAHVLNLCYHKAKVQKNGRKVDKEISFEYEILNEIASEDDLEGLDLSQDVICAIYESKTQLENARNYEYKHDVMHYEEGISELAMYMDAEEIPIEVSNRIDYERLYNALNKLSAKQRKRFYLYYGLGYCYREIADMEGVSWQAVRETVKAVKQKIVNIL